MAARSEEPDGAVAVAPPAGVDVKEVGDTKGDGAPVDKAEAAEVASAGVAAGAAIFRRAAANSSSLASFSDAAVRA